MPYQYNMNHKKIKMKIVAFAASNSSKSINLELIKAVSKQFGEHEVEILNLNDFEMPIYSQDRNEAGIPQLALDFNKHIQESDALIISLAEHNGSFSTAFKNIFDWGSRAEMKFFQEKPMLLLSTSPGARGGQTVMESAKGVFPYFGANIKNTFSFPNFYDNFKDGEIVNDTLKQQVDEVIADFKSNLS